MNTKRKKIDKGSLKELKASINLLVTHADMLQDGLKSKPLERMIFNLVSAHADVCKLINNR